MNKEEQALTKQLIKQISKLPRWSFGWLQTINGSIFQGRYVKQTIHRIQDGNSRIIFIRTKSNFYAKVKATLHSI